MSLLHQFRASVGRNAAPLARLYIRYSPFGAGKRFLWERVKWRERNYVARTQFNARMAGRSLDLVQSYIYYFGIWEPNLSAFIDRRLQGQADRGFVDVGANVGYFSLLAARHLTKGSVLAVEAFPSIYDKLNANVKLNGFLNIRTVLCAATDEERELQMFYAGPTNEGGTTSLTGRFATDPIHVSGKPLSAIITAEEIARIRLIKIDVEGGEYRVIQGMRPIIPGLRADAEIIVEVTPEMLGARSVAAIFDLFSTEGYFAYVLVNSYEAKYYLDASSITRPRRLRSLPSSQSDIIFSKIDAEYL